MSLPESRFFLCLLDPQIAYAEPLLSVLSDAERALARLDAATESLPNPDLFVSMYVRKEAVLLS